VDKKCIECDASIKIPSDVMQGEIVSCQDCGLDFEVEVKSENINLKKAEEVGEDWGE
tara:strand:- start:1669 stop:1839 length:171 start_codon:yes stop_codon:yes gene_type:complete